MALVELLQKSSESDFLRAVPEANEGGCLTGQRGRLLLVIRTIESMISA